MNLRQHTILVTGGSAGIGLALATRFHEAGARVLICGRDEARLTAAAAALPGVETLVADLRDPLSRERLSREVRVRAPGLSILVNNAGSQSPANYVHDSLAGVRARLSSQAVDEIALNCGAVVDLTVRLFPLLEAAPEAAVVFMSSGLALAPKKSAPVYCASKAFVHGFAKALRYQCEDDAPHVRVIEVLPPIVDTAMTAGPGKGKITPDAVAVATLAALRRNVCEVNVGKVRLLRLIQRLSPRLADRILRNG